MNDDFEFNPLQELTADITPRDFELYCCEGMKAIAEKEKLSDFTIRHDYHPEPYDGRRQIDIWCEYTALGAKQIIICECKMTKRKVEIGIVEKLKSRLDSLGAQRGYILSTAGFQKGAVDYAREHRIVLLQIFNKMARFIQNSAGQLPEEIIRMRKELYRRLPPYFIQAWNDGFWEMIYPTESMERGILNGEI